MGDLDHGDDYLQVYLEPFAPYLAAPGITDIYVNRPEEIWVETLGGSIGRHDAPGLTDALLWRLARQIASATHQGISRQHPLLAASLPGNARIQFVAPPAARSSIALAIRKHVSSDLSLGDFASLGAFDGTRRGDETDRAHPELERLYRAEDWPAFLAGAVVARKTIVVAGGTSTGKTTFLNSLLREVDAGERLILIEDTPELALRHQNAAGFIAVRGELGEAQVTTDELLIASLRMRPDRIIVGEIRGREAYTFLRAVNVGHPGSLTTIHADSPDRAVDQLCLLALQSGVGLRHEDVRSFVASSVDIFVQLERRNGRRSVSQVSWKDSLRA